MSVCVRVSAWRCSLAHTKGQEFGRVWLIPMPKNILFYQSLFWCLLACGENARTARSSGNGKSYVLSKYSKWHNFIVQEAVLQPRFLLLHYFYLQRLFFRTFCLFIAHIRWFFSSHAQRHIKCNLVPEIIVENMLYTGCLARAPVVATKVKIVQSLEQCLWVLSKIKTLKHTCMELFGKERK